MWRDDEGVAGGGVETRQHEFRLGRFFRDGGQCGFRGDRLHAIGHVAHLRGELLLPRQLQLIGNVGGGDGKCAGSAGLGHCGDLHGITVALKR